MGIGVRGFEGIGVGLGWLYGCRKEKASRRDAETAEGEANCKVKKPYELQGSKKNETQRNDETTLVFRCFRCFVVFQIYSEHLADGPKSTLQLSCAEGEMVGLVGLMRYNVWLAQVCL